MRLHAATCSTGSGVVLLNPPVPGVKLPRQVAQEYNSWARFCGRGYENSPFWSAVALLPHAKPEVSYSKTGSPQKSGYSKEISDERLKLNQISFLEFGIGITAGAADDSCGIGPWIFCIHGVKVFSYGGQLIEVTDVFFNALPASEAILFSISLAQA